MAKFFETQTILVDPFAPPVTNVNLNKDMPVREAAIISNTVKANGVREITLGIIYDDSLTSQYTLSLETILVGQNIAKVSNVNLSNTENIVFTEFIDHSIVDDTLRITILTISIAGTTEINEYSTEIIQLDPFNPIIVGILLPIGDFETLLESHLVNVGSLTGNKSVGAGTLNSVLIIVSEV